jgi:hypothetical protein
VKERLLTFGLAIAAFALFYALLAPKPSGPQELPTRPVSTEKGPNGYLAMMRWLQAEGVKPVSLRERYDRLHELTDSASRTGNLLITTTPHIYPIRNTESLELRKWIAAGNTMLVVAGLSDTPDWSMGEGVDSDFMAHMELLTGLKFSQPAPATAEPPAGDTAGKPPLPVQRPAQLPVQPPALPPAQQAEQKPEAESQKPVEKPEKKKQTVQSAVEAIQKLAQPQQFELVPNGPHPLLAGVKSVQALSEYPTGQWRADSDTVDLILELAQNPESGEPVLWLLRSGKGQIIVSAYGSILTNKLLGVHDNARLLANVVNWSRVGGGRVIIDDAHQGLVAFYDPAAFFGDKRLHASLWWLAGLWLVFVLGPQRLRAPGSGWNPVDITSFVRASGGFLARALKPATAGQRLFENFFNDIRRHTGLPANGAPMWDWIGARGTVAAHDVAQLQELHGKVLRGQRVDLSKLQNLLVQIRKNLL